MGRIERVAMTYITTVCEILAHGKLLYSTGTPAWCSVMTYRGARAGQLKREDIYIYIYIYIYILMTDLHCCMAETSTTL